MKFKTKSKWLKNGLELIFWPSLMIAAYYFSSFAVRFLQLAFSGFNPSQVEINKTNNLFVALISLIFFVMAAAVFYFVASKIKNRAITKKDIALEGWPTWADIALAIGGLIVSLILAGVLTEFTKAVLPNFAFNQTQNSGYVKNFNPFQTVVVFFMLVGVGPFIEEVMFRGVLYSKLRKINLPLAIILTSLVFGFLHGQLNVAIVTFSMSVVICLMREKITGTIWSGIFLHSLNNGIVFFAQFVAPFLIFLQK